MLSITCVVEESRNKEMKKSTDIFKEFLCLPSMNGSHNTFEDVSDVSTVTNRFLTIACDYSMLTDEILRVEYSTLAKQDTRGVHLEKEFLLIAIISNLRGED